MRISTMMALVEATRKPPHWDALARKAKRSLEVKFVVSKWPDHFDTVDQGITRKAADRMMCRLLREPSS